MLVAPGPLQGRGIHPSIATKAAAAPQAPLVRANRALPLFLRALDAADIASTTLPLRFDHLLPNGVDKVEALKSVCRGNGAGGILITYRLTATSSAGSVAANTSATGSCTPASPTPVSAVSARVGYMAGPGEEGAAMHDEEEDAASSSSSSGQSPRAELLCGAGTGAGAAVKPGGGGGKQAGVVGGRSSGQVATSFAADTLPGTDHLAGDGPPARESPEPPGAWDKASGGPCVHAGAPFLSRLPSHTDMAVVCGGGGRAGVRTGGPREKTTKGGASKAAPRPARQSVPWGACMHGVSGGPQYPDTHGYAGMPCMPQHMQPRPMGGLQAGPPVFPMGCLVLPHIDHPPGSAGFGPAPGNAGFGPTLESAGCGPTPGNAGCGLAPVMPGQPYSPYMVPGWIGMPGGNCSVAGAGKAGQQNQRDACGPGWTSDPSDPPSMPWEVGSHAGQGHGQAAIDSMTLPDPHMTHFVGAPWPVTAMEMNAFCPPQPLGPPGLYCPGPVAFDPQMPPSMHVPGMLPFQPTNSSHWPMPPMHSAHANSDVPLWLTFGTQSGTQARISTRSTPGIQLPNMCTLPGCISLDGHTPQDLQMSAAVPTACRRGSPAHRPRRRAAPLRQVPRLRPLQSHQRATAPPLAPCTCRLQPGVAVVGQHPTVARPHRMAAPTHLTPTGPGSTCCGV